jgi:hypothetical protein
MDHPSLDVLADLKAGEAVDAPGALEHLAGCGECQAGLARLERVGELLRSAPVPAPSELEWARLTLRTRRPVISWRMLAAACVVACAIPATLAWLLPPCHGDCGGGDMVASPQESVAL